MDSPFFNKIITAGMLIILLVLTFFLLKPILLSILVAFFLAFIFAPVYNLFVRAFKSTNFSAFLICLLLIILIVIPIWFLTPVAIDQSFKVYLASQKVDYITPLQKIFPSLAGSEFSAEIGSIIHSFVTDITNSLVNTLSELIFNLPTFILQLLVVFFTLFFVLRDRDALLNYIKSLLPFSKEVKSKLFEASKDITASVLYGQVIVGMGQGIIAGIGFFLAGVPNALLLTIIAALIGIFPIVGTIMVWVPVFIYLLIKGSTGAAIIVLIFGLISSNIDNFLRPLIVSKRTKIHTGLILISMIGGIFLFGVLGFIMGPLILAYLLIVLEIYRGKKRSDIFVDKSKK